MAPFPNESGLFRASLVWDEALKRAVSRALLPFDKPPRAKPAVAFGRGTVRATFSIGGVAGSFTLQDLAATYDLMFRPMLREIATLPAIEDMAFQSLAKRIMSHDVTAHAVWTLPPKDDWYLESFEDDLVRELGAKKDLATLPLWEAIQSAVPGVCEKVRSHKDVLARRRLTRALRRALASGLMEADITSAWGSVVVQEVMTK